MEIKIMAFFLKHPVPRWHTLRKNAAGAWGWNNYILKFQLQLQLQLFLVLFKLQLQLQYFCN